MPGPVGVRENCSKQQNNKQQTIQCTGRLVGPVTVHRKHAAPRGIEGDRKDKAVLFVPSDTLYRAPIKWKSFILFCLSKVNLSLYSFNRFMAAAVPF